MWRSEVLAFIREHIEPKETYRVGAGDVEFGELLPIKPGSVAQVEYEERTRSSFSLEQISKRLGEVASGLYGVISRSYETTDGYKVSGVDVENVENRPETVRIERTDS